MPAIASPVKRNGIGAHHGRHDVTRAVLLPSLRERSLTKYKVAASAERTIGKNR
jgi:hypothetical protein